MPIMYTKHHVLFAKIQNHSEHTAHHSQRVALLMQKTAQYHPELKHLKTQDILWAGLLHDMGKIKIPLEILNKTSTLTDKNINIIKKHPEDGYHILLIHKIPDHIAKTALQHHQTPTGGYPRKTQKLEDLSRLCQICDIFEAITSKERSYHTGKSIEETQKILKIMHRKGDIDQKCYDAFQSIPQTELKELINQSKKTTQNMCEDCIGYFNKKNIKTKIDRER